MGYKKGGTAIITLDYSPEIDAINAQLSNQDAQSTTLLHGLSAIITDQATATAVRLFGRTLVNLLGKDGNCEDVSKFTTIGSASVDSAVYKYGNKSLKITGAVAGGAGVQKDISIDNTADYLILTDVKSDSALQFYLAIQKSDGTTIKQSATVTTSSIFGISYVKISSVDLAGLTSLKIYARFALTASGQNGWIDGLRLFKIPQSIRDKVDVDPAYTGDALADKFPYVDSVQHVMNPYVKNSGKNLIPPFTSGKWGIDSHAKIIGDYELELNATGPGQVSTVNIPVISGNVYTISSPTNNSNSYVNIAWLDKSGSVISYVGSTTSEPATVTAPSNAVTAMVRVTNTVSGTFTFNNPQLELGSTATPFEPQNESYLYVAQDADKNPISLASNNDSSVADEVYQKDGQWYRLNRFKRDMVLDGSLGWIFQQDYATFKRTNATLSGTVLNDFSDSHKIVKFDGSIIKYIGSSFDAPDKSYCYNNTLSITISDTDSGWGDAYTPTVGEIKSHFFGWRMNNGIFGTAYNGTGTKSWVPIGDADNTRATTVLPTADAPTIAEGKIDHYKLTYQLAQATEEAIEVEGSLDLIDGGNQLQVGEAVIVREKINFTKGTGANTNTTYYANYNQVTLSGYEVPSGSQFDFATNQIIAVYKNGELTNEAKVVSSTNAPGGQGINLTSSLFDPTAEYTVTYIALETYKLSSAENSLDITYNTNIKTVVDAIVQKQEDDETNISVLKLQMIDAIARLTAGGL